VEFIHAAWVGARKVLAVVVVVGLLGGAVYSTATSPKIEETRQLQAKLERTLLDVDRLQRDNRRLKLLILNMKESPDLAEKVAREDAGLIREGEIIYIFPH